MTIFLTLAAACSVSTEALGQNSLPVAKVLSVSGKWTVESSGKAVLPGMPLVDQSRLRVEATPGAYIKMIMLADLTLRVYRCDDDGGQLCAKPIVVEAPGRSMQNFSERASTLLDSAVKLLLDKPQATAEAAPVTPMARGGGGAVLAAEALRPYDAVHGVDLRGLLGFLPKGRYSVSAVPWKHSTAAIESSLADQDEAAVLHLPAGLYRLNIFNEDAEKVGDVMLLVDGPPHYAADRKSFDSLAAVVARWQQSGDSDDSHLLLRAGLLLLGDGV